jgi:hypothetical protein
VTKHRERPRGRAKNPDRQRQALMQRLSHGPVRELPRNEHAVLEALEREGLAETRDGRIMLTIEGTAWLKRRSAPGEPFLVQHGVAPVPPGSVAPDARLHNDSESPLAWLARRKDASGKPLIAPSQFAAGERLREDFTRGAMMPRIGANWTAPVARGRRAGGGEFHGADSVLAAKERVGRAMAAVGPELSGVLLDVCCFLKGLETVEHERGWPRRTSKVVLGIALDRLARHYGIAGAISGRERSTLRAWQAPDARPRIA